MKFILVIYLIINPINDLDKIAKINKAKKEAEQAYLAENYILANEKYLYLKDSLGVQDDRLLLNLANTQYLLNDSTSAQKTYSELVNSQSKVVSSLAHQQLGAMEFKKQKYKEALEHYKSALKKAPDNEDARYNYELLKKLVKEQEEQQQQDQQNQDQQNKDEEKKDQQKQDQQNKNDQQQEEKKEDQQQDQQDKEQQEQKQQDQKEQDQEKQDQEEQQSEEQKKEEQKKQEQPNQIDEEKLKEMKISEEKARLILEAMKNNEVQYIQQNKRKAKKKKDPSKPDW